MSPDGGAAGPAAATEPPFRIVTRVPRRAWPLRAGRGLATLAGLLLVLGGVVLTIPAVALLFLLPLATFAGDGTTPTDWLVFTGIAVGATILLRGGLRVLRARRHLVLFLRRFGFRDASSALTFAVGGALGRHWRLVTLDDSRIAPVGVQRRTRLAWGLGQWLAVILLAAAVFVAARWWFGGGPEDILSGIWDSTVQSAEDSGSNGFEAAVAAFFVTLLVGFVVLALLLLLAVAAVSMLGVAGVASWRVSRAVRRAEGAKALSIAAGSAIDDAVGGVLARSRGIQAPRLVVLKVDDAVWREVVRGLAEESAVAIVDVSEPTEALAWEVAALREPAIRARPLLIGRRDRVEALAGGRLDGAGEAAARLREQLRGTEVLVYDEVESPRAMRRFTRSLASALERAAE